MGSAGPGLWTYCGTQHLRHGLLQIVRRPRQGSPVLRPKRVHLKGFALHTLIVAFGGNCSKSLLFDQYSISLGSVGFVGGYTTVAVMLDVNNDRCFAANSGC